MQNGIFKTDWVGVGESVLTAIITAVLTGFVSLAVTSGFDVFTANWVMIGHNMVNFGFIAGIVTLGKDLLTTNSGSLLGITPANTTT